MNSITFFLSFIPVLTLILLGINLIFAPHNPYQEKSSTFECGFHSFLGQNRTQFNISFFIFGLLFLVFDLELVMALPGLIGIYNLQEYGISFMIIFFGILTGGFVFEIGKNALNIDSRQYDSTFYSYINLDIVLKLKNIFIHYCRNFSLSRLIIGAIVTRLIVSTPALILYLFGFINFSDILATGTFFISILIVYTLFKTPKGRKLEVIITLLFNVITLTFLFNIIPIYYSPSTEDDISFDFDRDISSDFNHYFYEKQEIPLFMVQNNEVEGIYYKGDSNDLNNPAGIGSSNNPTGSANNPIAENSEEELSDNEEKELAEAMVDERNSSYYVKQQRKLTWAEIKKYYEDKKAYDQEYNNKFEKHNDTYLKIVRKIKYANKQLELEKKLPDSPHKWLRIQRLNIKLRELSLNWEQVDKEFKQYEKEYFKKKANSNAYEAHFHKKLNDHNWEIEQYKAAINELNDEAKQKNFDQSSLNKKIEIIDKREGYDKIREHQGKERSAIIDAIRKRKR